MQTGWVDRRKFPKIQYKCKWLMHYKSREESNLLLFCKKNLKTFQLYSWWSKEYNWCHKWHIQTSPWWVAKKCWIDQEVEATLREKLQSPIVFSSTRRWSHTPGCHTQRILGKSGQMWQLMQQCNMRIKSTNKYRNAFVLRL